MASQISLTQEQFYNAGAIVNTGRSLGATDDEIIGALSAGWSESRFLTSAVGDNGRAIGLFQQHPHYGSEEARRDPFTAARQFFTNLFGTRPSGEPIGERVADVQRPAAQHRPMYAENLPIAQTVFQRLQSAGRGPTTADAAERRSPRWRSWLDIDNWLRSMGLDVPEPTIGQTTGGTHVAGSAHYAGMGRDYGGDPSDEAAIARALLPHAQGPNRLLDELFYSPLGIFYDEGVPITPSAGLRSSHHSHVHAALNDAPGAPGGVSGPPSGGGDWGTGGVSDGRSSVGILNAVDDALNGGGLTDPAQTARTVMARGGVMLAGSIVSIFGLILVVSAIGSKSGAKRMLQTIPTPASQAAGAAIEATDGE